MRERGRFEQELLMLREPFNGEFTLPSEVKKAQHCIVLVAGSEYPRFEKNPRRDGRWYPKRVVPERDGRMGHSHWRTKCLRLAENRLARNPALVVMLFDLDQGSFETVQLRRGKVMITPVPGFIPLPMVDSDYRVINPVTQELSPLSKAGVPQKDPFLTGVSVAYCPHISQVSSGAVPVADWVKWLSKNRKLGHPHLGLGIEHVYEAIEAIGKQRPGSLAEFHLFGHASSSHDDANGTAFVNTYEWRGWNTGLSMPANRRSPLDLDARAHVDFAARSKSFAGAFATDAFSQVWGCNWHRPSHAIMHEVLRTLGRKPLTDTHTFVIPIGNTHLDPKEFEKLFTQPFARSSIKPVSRAPGSLSANKTVWSGLTGKWIREYYAALLDRTYMKRLARASGHHVLGGLPTTYSDYDNKMHGSEPMLSHIPMGTGLYRRDTNPPTFVRRLGFFRDTFQVTFGPGAHPKYGRGFAWYEP